MEDKSESDPGVQTHMLLASSLSCVPRTQTQMSELRTDLRVKKSFCVIDFLKMFGSVSEYL